MRTNKDFGKETTSNKTPLLNERFHIPRHRTRLFCLLWLQTNVLAIPGSRYCWRQTIERNVEINYEEITKSSQNEFANVKKERESRRNFTFETAIVTARETLCRISNVQILRFSEKPSKLQYTEKQEIPKTFKILILKRPVDFYIQNYILEPTLRETKLR